MTAVSGEVQLGTVFIVDDDEAIRDALCWLLDSRGVSARAWGSAEAFLADYDAQMAGCLLLDLRMEGMSGLDLFDRLCFLGCRLPVMFLTGHGDVPVAVTSLKKGAYDFVEKPFNDNDLVDRVIQALEYEARTRQQARGQASVAARLQRLSAREKQVMDLILVGKLNKVIADELGITMRTVEVHRANLFDKMGVKTAVELAQLLAAQR